jgi:hypothetical protein
MYLGSVTTNLTASRGRKRHKKLPLAGSEPQQNLPPLWFEGGYPGFVRHLTGLFNFPSARQKGAGPITSLTCVPKTSGPKHKITAQVVDIDEDADAHQREAARELIVHPQHAPVFFITGFIVE